MTLADSYTTLGLIESIKRRGSIPAGTGLTSSQMLQVATEEMRSYIPAFLKGLREEFLVHSVDLSVTSNTVAAPIRAVGAAFRTIEWVRSNQKPYPLNRIEPERVHEYAQTSGEPKGYVFQGNNIILVPTPTEAGGVIRLAYQLRPGQLVLPSGCAQITAINTGTNVLTFVSKPSTFTASVLFDLVSATPNFVALAMDQTVTFPTSTTVQFSSLPSTLAVGDYLCLAGETCLPPLPTEVHDLLAQATAAKLAKSTGSTRAQIIQSDLTDLKKDMTVILSPRSDGSSRPIISRSRVGRGYRF